MAKHIKKRYRILVAEDSELDRMVLLHFFREANPLHSLHHVKDGAEAIAYLDGRGNYSDRLKYPFPDLAVIDLKMPKRDGFEVLEWLRTQPFKKLAVVVLSGSNLPGERDRALALGAHRHEIKPFDNELRRDLVRRLENFMIERRAAMS